MDNKMRAQLLVQLTENEFHYQFGVMSHTLPLDTMSEIMWQTMQNLRSAGSPERFPDWHILDVKYPAFSSTGVRRASREVDFGSWWKSTSRDGFWRVSWVENTGELYSVHFDTGTVILLGVFRNSTKVHDIMSGWSTDQFPILEDFFGITF